MADIGLLILRLVLGLTIAAHGAQKLFGWFGGAGLQGFGGMMEKMNLRPGWLWALAGGMGEFAGGLLLALGLLTPVGSALVISGMMMAIAMVHLAKGFWNTNGGYEYNLVNVAAAMALGLTGPGAYALDAALPPDIPWLTVFSVSMTVVLVGVAACLLIQERHAARVPRAQ
jgi:putative oxidoreductase